jgi:DNA primase
MIPQDFIQQLLDRTDIVAVVERYVPLKKAGANYQSRCPFHSEKSPSFSVSPTKQFYHCFGCGAHGTAITFLMEHAGYSFVEAVKELAGQVGLQVPTTAPSGRPRRKAGAKSSTSAWKWPDATTARP